MDDAERSALVSELLFYITAALVTFLAVLISFKWIYRKTLRKETQETDKKLEQKPQETERQLQTTSEDLETEQTENLCPLHSFFALQSLAVDKSQQMFPDSTQDVEEEDLADIRDVLINHKDIKPIDVSQTEGVAGGNKEQGVGDTGDKEEGGSKPRAGPQKTKELVEEVSKMMSAEQKAEERRIQSEQLEAIFNLVQNQQDTFGIDSFQDIQDQFKLYA